MTDMIIVYITCKDANEAYMIGTKLLSKRLCACINMYEGMRSKYFWPPGAGTFEEAEETVLLVKSIKSKFTAIEKEVVKHHSSETPCVIALPVVSASKKYYTWIRKEIR